MTKEQLASQLTGREYGSEITKQEETLAKDAGLVVLFGYSDDNAEFRGAINDEVSCCEGGELLVNRKGCLEGSDHECDCDYCGYKHHRAKCAVIKAVWDKGGYSWTYRTDIPHATFEVVEGTDSYCRGIVFNIKDLPAR